MTRKQTGDSDSEPPLGREESPRVAEDAWVVLSYLLTGVFLFGGIGWGLDRLLGTTFLVVVGLLAGASLSIYVIYLRFGRF